MARLRRLTRDADVVHAHGLRAGGLAALALTRAVSVPLRGTAARRHAAQRVDRGRHDRRRVRHAGAHRRAGRHRDPRRLARPGGADARARRRARSAARWCRRRPHRRSEGPAAQAKLRAELGAADRPLIVVGGTARRPEGAAGRCSTPPAGWDRRTPVPLVAIAGDGPLEDTLRARIEAEELPVRLLGRRSDVPELLAAADVAVVPSVWEGQPLIVQEVLRAGQAAGGHRGSAAFRAWSVTPRCSCRPATRPPCEAAVVRVLDDPALAGRLASAAVAQARRLPTEEDAIDQLTGVYARATRYVIANASRCAGRVALGYSPECRRGVSLSRQCRHHGRSLMRPGTVGPRR